MSRKLAISDDLSLPIDAITSTFAIMAIRGVGKTHTASVMAEEMLKAGQPVVVYDPTGAWWGLKSSVDGKRPGFPVVIFGGEHADVPLEETAGDTIATTIVQKRIPAILDCSLMRKGSRTKFMTAFCETLYHKNREPLHFFCDEAHTLAPGNVAKLPEAARLLGAMEDIVLQGRMRGLGLTVISQRPALVNTSVRTQCQTLIAMRIMGPHDLKAIREWTDAHGTPEQSEQLLSSLATEKIGEGWVWSPAFLGIFAHVKFRPRETFDSSATPKVGGKVISPKRMAEIDLAALGAAIQATVEQKKANDPAELKRLNQQLRAEIAKLQKAKPTPAPPAPPAKRVEVSILKDGQVQRLEKSVASMEKMGETLLARAGELKAAMAAVKQPVPAPRIIAPPRPAPAPRPLPRPVATEPPAEGLSKAQQRILDSLAWYESLGKSSVTLSQIGAVALIDPTGGYFSNVVAPLSSGGLVVRGSGTLALTDAGRALAKPIEDADTLDKYYDVLRKRVRQMKNAGGKTIDILDFIISRGGEAVTGEEVGIACGIDHTGGYFSNMIAPLSTAGLIERSKGTIKPTDVLFPEGLRKTAS